MQCREGKETKGKLREKKEENMLWRSGGEEIQRGMTKCIGVRVVVAVAGERKREQRTNIPTPKPWSG